MKSPIIKHEQSEKAALILLFLVIAIPALLLFAIDAFRRSEESRFLTRLQTEIKNGNEEIKLSDITPFDWDRLEILIDYAPSSFAKGIELHSFLHKNDINYSYLDTLYVTSIPSLLGLQEDYGTAFIFIDGRNVSKIFLFQDFTLTIGDTSYHLHDIRTEEKNGRDSTFVNVKNKKIANALLKEIGIHYKADLVFSAKEEG